VELVLGLKTCPCVKTACKRHGLCDECIANHNQKPENPLPWCMRPENKELLLEHLANEKKMG